MLPAVILAENMNILMNKNYIQNPPRQKNYNDIAMDILMDPFHSQKITMPYLAGSEILWCLLHNHQPM